MPSGVVRSSVAQNGGAGGEEHEQPREAHGAEPRPSEELAVTRPKLLNAADLDRMSPNERAAAVIARIVTDLAVLPKDFRNRVEATAQRLAHERRQMKK